MNKAVIHPTFQIIHKTKDPGTESRVQITRILRFDDPSLGDDAYAQSLPAILARRGKGFQVAVWSFRRDAVGRSGTRTQTTILNATRSGHGAGGKAKTDKNGQAGFFHTRFPAFDAG
jgi:hypothetical protein